MTTLSENTLSKNHIDLIEIDEVFVQISNWNNYFISNKGRLLHKNKKGKLNIVRASITNGGYFTYTLSKPARTYNGVKVRDKNGNIKQIRTCKPAQVLVAMLYVPSLYPEEYKIQEDLEVHHRDHNRKNNESSNLMWLCKNKNGRTDHGFINTIKKISLYDQETTIYHTYNNIELLAKRLDIDFLELIDSIRNTDMLFKSQDGKWNVYKVNDSFIGVSFNRDKV